MMGRDPTGNAASPPPAMAYSYLRLSSKRQANKEESKAYRDGFRRQIAMRDAYLAANPHLTLDTRLVLHDIGVSGFTNANAADDGDGKLGQFLREVEAGRIARGSYLLVESLDRVTRQQVNLAQSLLLRLINAGIVVVSIIDKEEYREEGPPTQLIMSVVRLSRAHEESLMKSARLRQTWAQKRAMAAERPLSGRCPAWLDLVDGKFEPNKERVPIVREVLGYLADGWGRDKIAQALNARKEPPWGHGKLWHGGTVQKLTDSRALIGEYQPHKLVHEARKGIMVSRRVPVGEPIPDYFPRVVDEDLWDRAQAVAAGRRLGKAPNAGGRQGTVISNLFGTVATCAVCGGRMTYRDRGPRSFPVLRCSAERAGGCTNKFRYFYDDNEAAILSWLVHVDMSGGAKGEAARLEDELRTEVARCEALQAEGEAIVRAIGQGSRFATAPLAEIQERLTRAERRVVELRGKLAALDKGGRQDDRTMAVTQLMVLRREEAPPEKIYAARARIRQIIRDSFESMVCHPTGEIRIRTIDGTDHLFRDGYWWYEPDEMWIPWAGSMLGGGYRANRAELRRRGVWLQAFKDARDASKGS